MTSFYLHYVISSNEIRRESDVGLDLALFSAEIFTAAGLLSLHKISRMTQVVITVPAASVLSELHSPESHINDICGLICFRVGLFTLKLSHGMSHKSNHYYRIISKSLLKFANEAGLFCKVRV